MDLEGLFITCVEFPSFLLRFGSRSRTLQRSCRAAQGAKQLPLQCPADSDHPVRCS